MTTGHQQPQQQQQHQRWCGVGENIAPPQHHIRAAARRCCSRGMGAGHSEDGPSCAAAVPQCRQHHTTHPAVTLVTSDFETPWLAMNYKWTGDRNKDNPVVSLSHFYSSCKDQLTTTIHHQVGFKLLNQCILYFPCISNCPQCNKLCHVLSVMQLLQITHKLHQVTSHVTLAWCNTAQPPVQSANLNSSFL